MNTPDDNPQNVPVLSYQRARRFVIWSWVVRIAGLAIFPFAFWFGLALTFFSSRLDAAFVPPRPEPPDMSPRLSAFLRVFIVCFLTGWLGRIFAPESTWSLAVLGFGFAGILVVEAPHYARADAAFLRSLRDAESAEIPVVEVGS